MPEYTVKRWCQKSTVEEQEAIVEAATPEEALEKAKADDVEEWETRNGTEDTETEEFGGWEIVQENDPAEANPPPAETNPP